MGISGHVSVRDPEFDDYIWMNPLDKHFGLMTAEGMICLDLNTGAVVGGNKVRILSQHHKFHCADLPISSSHGLALMEFDSDGC